VRVYSVHVDMYIMRRTLVPIRINKVVTVLRVSVNNLKYRFLHADRENTIRPKIEIVNAYLPVFRIKMIKYFMIFKSMKFFKIKIENGTF